MARSFRVFSFKIINIFKGLISIISKFYSFLWSILSNREYWSGLFPTLILALAAWYGLSQTRSQLKLLQEQITYVRQPMLFFSPRMKDSRSTGLYIANIGNDTVQNVNIRLGLFLVTETEIYSYGELQWPAGILQFDSPRPPRESLWPLLSLAPNEERDLTHRLELLYMGNLYMMPILVNHSQNKEKAIDSIIINDMFTIKDSLKGDYVLFAEYFCRRKTDFVGYAETTYFRYYPYPSFLTNLNLEIGGFKIINRLKTYMQNGPELSIKIWRDAYEVYKNNIGYPSTTLIKKISRKN